MQTFIPALDAARAMPRPMPSEEAVIYATLPRSSCSGAGCDTAGSGGMGGIPGRVIGPTTADGLDCATAYRDRPSSARMLAAPTPYRAPSERKRRRSSAKRSRPAGNWGASFLDILRISMLGWSVLGRVCLNAQLGAGMKWIVTELR